MREPMAANWRSCSGVALVLAPRPSICVRPWAAGMAEMMAARSTPGSVLSTKCAIAVRAPVLPAETAAAARPSCTRLMATRIEESFLCRIASRGFSSMVTTWEAATIAARSRSAGAPPASSRSMSVASPMSSTLSCASSPSARSAPATYSRGSESPLITSIAIGSTLALCGPAQSGARGSALFLVFALGGLLDDALAAVEAIGRDAVTQMRLTGLRVGRQGGLGQTVVRAVHAAARRRLAAFLNGHGSNSSIEFGSLTFQQVRQLRKRTVRLTGARREPGGRSTAALAFVQRHDRQAQQQLLGHELSDADATAGGQHRLQVLRDLRHLLLGIRQRHPRRRVQ